MRIIDPKAEIMIPEHEVSARMYMLGQMKMVEAIGRKCYKSEDKITADSYDKFIRMLVSKGHEAMIEHGHFSVCFTVDRGGKSRVGSTSAGILGSGEYQVL